MTETKATIEIQKGIPLPPNHMRRKYPFSKMEVGDSFFVEGDFQKLRNTLNSCFCRYKPKRFIVRKENGGARCWRAE